MIYFALFDPGVIKIGFSADPFNRVKQIIFSGGVVMPDALDLKSGRILKVADGDKQVEKSIHHQLQKERITGEWFRDCRLIREFIETIDAAPYSQSAYRFNVAIPEPLYKKLQQVNAKTGVPVTVIVQQAVNRYLETQKAATA